MAPKTSDNGKIQKARRNERERKRVDQVNKGFHDLRDRVPLVAQNKKMSKVETLRQATKYIQQLKAILESVTPSHHSPQMNVQEGDFDGRNVQWVKTEEYVYPPSQFDSSSHSLYYPTSSSSENSFSETKYSYAMH
ncbi:hypothetical protein PENTCL1PPCAC_6523 [Pristionchus entomophagus]|uniref:BHLH domain-containing protein n=1 Tax=Pristionchus entomophagus TaxID=358040 RepID=A0AAV5SML8_9BILA|nr:hypothetical protein PENTCL1PPCAC_6523 [Pristionchus entomophagus]